VWKTTLGKNLTLDNLRKRHVDRCCMCKKRGESIDHLLLHNKVAKDLWVLVLSLFETEWIIPQRILELLASLVATVV
jgi:hypothetical protein